MWGALYTAAEDATIILGSKCLDGPFLNMHQSYFQFSFFNKVDDWQKWRLKDVKIFLLKEFNSAHQTLLSITLPLTGLADQSKLCLHLLDIKICS